MHSFKCCQKKHGQNLILRKNYFVIFAIIRGKKYFPHCSTTAEKYKECEQAVIDPTKGVIVPDKRLHKNSTHVCLFINGSKQNIALPLAVQEDGKIGMITIKNIAESKQKPDWFYDEYSKIAKTRKMPEMNRVWRPQYENEKD